MLSFCTAGRRVSEVAPAFSCACVLNCFGTLQELDLGAFKLVGERHHLWRGALHGGVFVEGPHMYKHEGSYYLMAAEGGTGVNHAEVIAISCLSLMWFVMLLLLRRFIRYPTVQSQR